MQNASIVFYADHIKKSLTIRCKDGNDGESSTGAASAFPVRLLQELGTDEAQKRVGAAVLLILEALYEGALGLADYKREIDEATKRVSLILEERAAVNNADAQYALALHYIAESAQLNNVDLLESAELWLTKAAASGHEDATNALNTWPRTKELQRRFITTRNSGAEPGSQDG